MAKSKKVKSSNDERHLRQVGPRKYDITGYRRVKTTGGFVSYDCGDQTAKELEGKKLPEVYEIAAKRLSITALSLKRKYGKLNPGMQRMALGNRIRAAQ